MASEKESKVGSELAQRVEDAGAIALTPKTVRDYLSPTATDQEIALFLNQCAMFGLNPFKREIYLIKYGNNPATFVVGYEVYLKRAERSDKWDGLESGTEGNGPEMKAWAKVYRKDWTRPLYHEVYYTEYAQYKDEWVNGQKTGKKSLTKFWLEKPQTMLKKVAICQAFRMAFPDEFAGMPYTAEEMPVDHSRLPVAEVVPDQGKPPLPTRPSEKAGPIPSEDGLPGSDEPIIDAEVEPSLTPQQEVLKKLIGAVAEQKKLTVEAVKEKIKTNIVRAGGQRPGVIPDSLSDEQAVTMCKRLTAWVTGEAKGM